MPRGDGTGPMGLGSMTGRGAGYCGGSGMPGYANPGPGMGRRFLGRRGPGLGMGRGFGRGLGRGPGRGWGRGWYWPAQPYWANDDYYLDRGDEKTVLTGEVRLLKSQLAQMERRLRELDAEADRKED